MRARTEKQTDIRLPSRFQTAPSMEHDHSFFPLHLNSLLSKGRKCGKAAAAFKAFQIATDTCK